MFKTEKIVLRTPFYPFDPDDQWNTFRTTLSSPSFKEALFLASPALYNEFIKSGENINEDTLLSLYKYFLRMSFRCTPFGMFSGVSAGSVGATSLFQLKPQQSYSKHTRLDNHFLNSFIQKITTDESLRKEIKWFTNNTLYSDGSHIRYVEYRLTANQRSHHLARVKQSNYLDLILATAINGARVTDLIKMIEGDEVSEADANAFINELIESKLLLSELEPIVTGEEPGIRLLSILRKYESGESYARFLQVLIDTIHKIDVQGPGADLSLYERVVACVREWDNEYDPKLLFQSDLSKPVESIQLGEEIIAELKKTLTFLAKLNEPPGSLHLKLFREEFSKRYENSEVPLLAVLDTESGLGYPANVRATNDQSPLLDGLGFQISSATSEHNLIVWQKRLLQLYQECLYNKEIEIIINDDTFSLKDQCLHSGLADSIYSIVSVLGSTEEVENGNFQLDFRVSTGPSAANLLGRFCYANAEISNMVNELIAQEEQLHPEKIFAEVVHLAQARIGNVLLRPSFRKYEIPILTFSGVDPDHTIALDDLMVSIRHNKIILRSKKFNREVLPRNTNAHNYSNETIPYYHFLCDLQNQEMPSRLNWDWGVLNEFKFLPRVRYGKTILSKARWIVEEKDLKLPAHYDKATFLTALNQYAYDHQLPRLVVLSQADNQLPIHLNDEMCVRILMQELKRHKSITLEESLFTGDTLAIEGPEGKFTNEFIIPWTKITVPQPVQRMPFEESIVHQNFIPGSEWHYIKIYSGIKTSDRILTEVIKPLADELLAQEIIYGWFFIRYTDPDHHLRIRFKGNGDFSHILTRTLNEQLSPYLQNGQVWKVQTDTYKRELERYGHENIESSEELFFYDSIATTGIIQLLDGDEGDTVRWQFALKGVNDLLNDFGYTLKEKEEFMTSLRNGFAREFNATGKESQKQLSDKYRKSRKEIEFILKQDIDEDHDFAEVWNIFKHRSDQLTPVISQIKERCFQNSRHTLNELMDSYIHMFINRFMRSKQRMHELVIYDLLCQHYKSEIARQKTLRQTSRPVLAITPSIA